MNGGFTRHARLWTRTASMSLQAQLTYRLGSAGFLLGKIVRFVFFFAFVAAVFRRTDRVAGYTLEQTALFFLTFNVVDMVAQVFFRGVYNARRVVNEGDFDFYLIQPVSPLLRMVCSSVDALDAATLVPVLALTCVLLRRLPGAGWLGAAAYAALTLNALALVFAVHVAVAALAVRTQELENAVWIYRDVMFMGRFPVDVYAFPVRLALTFAVPVAVMTSFPAKAYLGRLSPAWIAYAFALGAGATAAALAFWRSSVARYASSSS